MCHMLKSVASKPNHGSDKPGIIEVNKLIRIMLVLKKMPEH
jgi:hypothetical protein